MKKVLSILKYCVLAVLIFLASIFVWIFIQTKISPDKIPSIFGYKPFIVLSGSMESELYRGDLAIVKNINADALKKKDIIAFRDEENYVVTHRIIDVINNNGEIAFVTKGDNNNAKDSGIVKAKNVEGIYISKISGFGNVLLVMQKPITLIITLIIIAVIGTLWIMLGNNKLSKEEKLELERLRKEKQQDK